MNERSPKDAAKLIVALDLSTEEEARELAGLITPAVNFFKIGTSLFCAQGPSIIKTLKDMGASIFLDLKLHDIPEQVRRSAKIIGAFGADMVSVHCLGGQDMLRAAKEGLADGAAKAGLESPLVVGVTVLTSLDNSDLEDMGINNKV
ncbi:MAG TPA: orotidine-5'-phosphate decarboxylase, partial [Actinobacteria bacterium]|nr:orotidine-5'-phosphate decarboxylase [Actinomycetota bacterium]